MIEDDKDHFRRSKNGKVNVTPAGVEQSSRHFHSHLLANVCEQTLSQLIPIYEKVSLNVCQSANEMGLTNEMSGSILDSNSTRASYFPPL